MSETAPEQEPAFNYESSGLSGFSSLMDTMAPDDTFGKVAAGGETSPAATEGAGVPPAPVEGTPAATPVVDPPAAGEAGKPGLPAPAATTANSTGADTGVGELDAVVIAPRWGEISKAIEAKATETHQGSALTAVREQYAKHFEAIAQHPRLLIGKEVPAIGREGMETLKDSADAREWQEAVKGLLAQEVHDRASRLAEGDGSKLEVLQASVELFSKNSDLIPGSKQFNRALADEFATIVKPYEVRENGKLQGFSIPVQPIVDLLRKQQSAPAAAPAAAVPPPAASPGPQAGIASKAGAGDTADDYSVLFGTLGLPNLRI